MQHIEDNEQMILIRWAQFESGRHPELSLLFHVPNGGKRSKVEAARFKAMGVQAGVPDLFLPVPRGAYHGLFIEMKAPKGRTSNAQNTWIEKLKSNGYAVKVCYHTLMKNSCLQSISTRRCRLWLRRETAGEPRKR